MLPTLSFSSSVTLLLTLACMASIERDISIGDINVIRYLPTPVEFAVARMKRHARTAQPGPNTPAMGCTISIKRSFARPLANWTRVILQPAVVPQLTGSFLADTGTTAVSGHLVNASAPRSTRSRLEWTKKSSNTSNHTNVRIHVRSSSPMQPKHRKVPTKRLRSVDCVLGQIKVIFVPVLPYSCP